VTVFCGSSFGADPAFRAAAADLGRLLAEAGIGLVYGGARVGLMGTVADAALEAGGEVIGVIPQRIVDREVAHRGLTELRVVETMHERKAQMNDLADAFVVLPGGLGTLEEIFEILTWQGLGYHAKPSVFVDVNGFWTGLLVRLDEMAASGFVAAEAVRRIGRVGTSSEVLSSLAPQSELSLAQTSVSSRTPGFM
jgi:uncharacterized protein (TIGR00730 family)